MRQSILIVRQDRTGRRLLGRILRGEGYEVREAANALEAMTQALCGSRPVDLLLTDAGLPGIDGWKLAEKLRQAFPATRVVCLGGETEVPEPAGLECRVLPPAVEPGELLAVVRRALDSAARKAPASAGQVPEDGPAGLKSA
ncbi:MAG: response regulator [Bryobacterales bacterium]|nr:response regulator [Bryobacterales bacterium]